MVQRGMNGRGLAAGSFIPSSSSEVEATSQSDLQVQQPVQGEGRGLGAKLPSNLRLEEFINKRIEYEGVSAGHRTLVRVLVPFA